MWYYNNITQGLTEMSIFCIVTTNSWWCGVFILKFVFTFLCQNDVNDLAAPRCESVLVWECKNQPENGKTHKCQLANNFQTLLNAATTMWCCFVVVFYDVCWLCSKVVCMSGNWLSYCWVILGCNLPFQCQSFPQPALRSFSSMQFPKSWST